MATNTQVALEQANISMKGLLPVVGKSSYTAEELANQRLKLANIYLAWLNAGTPEETPPGVVQNISIKGRNDDKPPCSGSGCYCVPEDQK